MIGESGIRLGDRVFVSLPIRVAGMDTAGVEFEEETVTISVNKRGACVSLTHLLSSDKVVRIRNLRNGMEGEFRVVGEVQQIFSDRREWGLEVINGEPEIWGEKFTTPNEEARPGVLIQCSTCRRMAIRSISSIEFDVLLHTGMISRHCDACGETTRWHPYAQPQAAVASSEGDMLSPQSRSRRAQRLKLTMRLWVRNGEGETEVVRTKDASKSGVCFQSERRYRVGDEIYIVLPYAANEAPKETKAKVVWSHTREGVYGASYVK
jgi:hypothetical protein